MFLLHAGRYKTDRCRYRGAVSIMEQLGHFPMSENPEQFRRYISPVLDQIPAGASE